MPPKPASDTDSSSREMEVTVQAVSDKLGSLQLQLTDLQHLQDSRHESLRTMMQALMEQFSALTSIQHQPPPINLPPPPITDPPIVTHQRPNPIPTTGPTTPPTSVPNSHTHNPAIPFFSPNPYDVPPTDSHTGPIPNFYSPLHPYYPNFQTLASPVPVPNIRPPKLQLLPFEGADPLDWLFQAEQFFTFYNIPVEQRLSMAAFYMKGEALSWFKWMFQNGQLSDWMSFVRALELRFGPSTYDNFQAELFKLRQNGSVSEYQSQFEKLCNRVYGIPPEALLNCFISGLYPDIRKELAILKPHTISQALGLAKLIEAKLKDTKPKHFRPTYPTTSQTSHSNTTKFPTTPPNPNPSPLAIKKLNPSQMQERRAQGLCYNCDEKYIPGHKCSTPKFLLFMTEDDDCCDDNSLPEPANNDTDPDPLHFQLSSQAMIGHTSPRVLKFHGLIAGLQVSILVDTGSSHNIIQPRIANYINLSLSSIKPFIIMVGNGEHLTCNQLCPKVPLKIHNHLFVVPCYLLTIEGADVVLGLDWLSTLGQITANFATPSLSFHYHDNPITLAGHPSPDLQLSSYTNLYHLSHTNAIASCHLLSITPLPNTESHSLPSIPTPTDLEQLSPEIQTILLNFPTLFNKPKDLPPSRPHDHHINLIPNTKPIYVKPYRYPHHQKATITHLISEMLTDGIIKPSHSPFSSPVLLVKKKMAHGGSAWIIEP